MNFDFEHYLEENVNRIAADFGFDIKFVVGNEEIFSQLSTEAPNVVFIIVKHLTDSKIFNGVMTTKPLNITIFAEQNTLMDTLNIMKTFATNYNWKIIREDDISIKQQYTDPVVLSNFNEVGYGYRTVLYISSILYVTEGVLDLQEWEENNEIHLLTIDDEEQQVVSFQIGYSMSGDTKPFPNTFFAKTVRSVQTFGLTISIPSIDNAFTRKIFNVLNAQISGNVDFILKFKILNMFNLSMKVSSVTFITTPDGLPGITVGFIL